MSGASENPFFHRGPIQDPRYFFGRRSELREACGLLDNVQNVSITGPARIGKTSLLLHLARPATLREYGLNADNYSITYVSLEGLADLKPPAFFAHLLAEAYRQGESKQALKGRTPPGEAINFLQFSDALEGLAATGLRFVWLLDEFDLAGENPAFDLNFFSALRHVASRSSVAFVTSSERSLYDVEKGRRVGSPFADLFTTVALGPLLTREAHSLIHELSHGAGVSLDSEAEFAMQATSGWPMFLQLLCGMLLDQKRRSRRLTASVRDNVLHEFREQARPHLAYIWSRLPDVERTAILEARKGRAPTDPRALREVTRLRLVERKNDTWRVSPLFDELVEGQAAPHVQVAISTGVQEHAAVQQAVRALIKVIETRDPSLRLHSDATANWAAAIGRQMSLPPADLEGLKVAARLHDLGLVGISDLIIKKPGPLTRQEREIVEMHPLLGVHILEALDLPWPVRPAVRGHHERLEGSGYPDGLMGEEIPLWARIIAVAETVDFMFSDKPWRKAYTMAKIVQELRSKAGVHYDERVVEALLGLPQVAQNT